MNNNKQEEVLKLRNQKRGKGYISKKTGLSLDEINEVLKGSGVNVNYYHVDNKDWPTPSVTYSYTVNKEEGTLKSEAVSNFEPKSDEELASLHKVDLTRYKITSYWTKQRGTQFTSSLLCNLLKPGEFNQDKFIEFLSTYKAPKISISKKKSNKIRPNGCLIINKQDEHINKHDIDGNNDMEERMVNVIDKTITILDQSSLSNNLEEIIYVIGSDGFNSEWTGATTKFTPQRNIDSYQESFELICDYEIGMISILAEYTNNLKVVYLAGNHDEYVGWHLISWLQTYFRQVEGINFDSDTKYRKYLKYSNTALLLNHGDAIKPEKLAGMFPIEFKDDWSSCDNHFIFTGDKHHLLAKDFNGIQFYQIPSLSKATSLWDDKNGHTCSKAELTAFLIQEDLGMTNIYKQPL